MTQTYVSNNALKQYQNNYLPYDIDYRLYKGANDLFLRPSKQ